MIKEKPIKNINLSKINVMRKSKP